MNTHKLRHDFVRGAVAFVQSHPGEDTAMLIDKYRNGKGLRRAYYATLTEAQRRKLFYEIRAKAAMPTVVVKDGAE